MILIKCTQKIYLVIVVILLSQSISLMACTDTQLLTRILHYLDYSLLNESEQDIVKYVAEIRKTMVENNLDNERITAELSTIVEHRISYHKQNIESSVDPKTIGLGTVLTFIGTIGALISASCYSKMLKTTTEIRRLRKQHNIKDHIKIDGNIIKTYVSGTDIDALTRLVQLSKDDRFYIRATLMSALIAFWPLVFGITRLRTGFFDDPRHQERYDKLSLFKQCLIDSCPACPVLK